MSPDNKNSSIIPTGEAQVGRVQTPAIPTGEAQVGRVQTPAASAPIDDSPTPVLEHEVQPAPEDDVPATEPAAPAEGEEAAASEEEQAAQEPEPESGLPEPVVSHPVASAAPAPLQESVPVPIPVRMNQLHTDNKRLRNDLDALERALKKPMS